METENFCSLSTCSLCFPNEQECFTCFLSVSEGTVPERSALLHLLDYRTPSSRGLSARESGKRKVIGSLILVTGWHFL